ncbi:lysophospholipase L1-like esterase [Kineosphaera limosa]|uniref:SGNH hydrolase-type esterase domain-containing protein n=1 Tax=Kineosphaera limosa NBRC 100340 TaxID=1184609 RepID=K6XFK4_9MICO|nr:SGNH/GDSL hydrolase family protein [Kineosphaera limosa]NYD99499.1 lysophospholipase L1-like esterase [Kineosphaera limosa]GAB97629.1 hypothetical protein KILIM_076_00140 [Kineosphaera limosa NBRC 100340]
MHTTLTESSNTTVAGADTGTIRPRGAARVVARLSTAAALAAAVALAVTTAAGAATPPMPPGQQTSVAYLALGDSLTAGYQPDRAGRRASDDPRGGFVGIVAAGLARQPDIGTLGRRVQVTNLGCTGETSATMVEGGRCTYRGHASQLSAARAYLRANPQTALVTVTIGANDVRACLSATDLDRGCANRAFDLLEARLGTIVSAIRADAPGARVVVTDYYNPYLAARLTGPEGRRLATASIVVHAQLNAIIRKQAADHGARTARVAAAFDTSDNISRVDVPGIGRVPRNVARICAWTWMCARPATPDIHPNDEGYARMGQAVLTRLAQNR